MMYRKYDSYYDIPMNIDIRIIYDDSNELENV